MASYCLHNIDSKHSYHEMQFYLSLNERLTFRTTDKKAKENEQIKT